MALSSHRRVIPAPWAHRGGKVHKGRLSLDSLEQALRRRFEGILHTGIENVSDHDMHKCYLARLEAPLSV
jgi:hypothetical protein